MDYINSIIWKRDYWLPNNFTWEEVGEYNHVDRNFYYLIVLFACLIYSIRIFFENFVSTPIGKHLNLRHNPECKPNTVLEACYLEKGPDISDSLLQNLSDKTDLNKAEIKKWFISRKLKNKPSKLKKFNESCWRFVYYFTLWSYGVFILYDKPWFWTTDLVWLDYPKQLVTNDLYFYYLISLGFYVSLLVTQFFDVKRKDFWQMFAHHLVTISLMIFSILCNYTRIGCLILVIHDSADYWLEFAKMCLYCKKKIMCDLSFGMFTIVWFITRLVIFPARVLYATTYAGLKYLEGSHSTYPAYYIFNFLLISLQIMHIVWFYMILCVLARVFSKDKKVKDERSDSESDNEDEDEQKNHMKDN